jgi:hypothetical protein
MSRPRWYASMTKTADDRVFVQGGKGGEDLSDVREPDGSIRSLTGIDLSSLYWWYPRNFSSPDGRIFGYTAEAKAYTLSTAGTGSIVLHGKLPIQTPGVASSSTLFAPGRVLQCGGGNYCAIVDFNAPRPVARFSAGMAATREWNSGTALPDGRVLITGGSEVWSDTQVIGASLAAEIYDPKTGQWLVGAAAVQPRMYHSTALLLPDATVLVAGGSSPGPLTQRNAELYQPPYLFAPGGALAVRPVIRSAPTVMTPGSSISVDVDDASRVARLTLVKTGSVTHSFNMDQAFVELPFKRSGNTISATVPDSGGDLTPGFYMIFVLDSAGVPSVAKIARLSIRRRFRPSRRGQSKPAAPPGRPIASRARPDRCSPEYTVSRVPRSASLARSAYGRAPMASGSARLRMQ